MELPSARVHHGDNQSTTVSVPTIVDKQYLINNYQYILERGKLDAKTIENLLNNRELNNPAIVIQSTSGSYDKPLLIPRSRADIDNIALRIMAVFKNKFGALQ